MVIGVLLGILVGVLPGLGAPNGVSLLLPLTFGMQPVSAIILLSRMYWGALFGGSVTSILFNIPGEPSLSRRLRRLSDGPQWRPTTALPTAFGSAAFGALVGVVLITPRFLGGASRASASGRRIFRGVFPAFASLSAWAVRLPSRRWCRSRSALHLRRWGNRHGLRQRAAHHGHR